MITVLQTNEFAKWLKRLKDVEARARILVRIRRLPLTENFGDAKSVGDGVYEMRIEQRAWISASITQDGTMRWSCSSSAETNHRNSETSRKQKSLTSSTDDGSPQ